MPCVSPSDEACQALVEKINVGSGYILEADVRYSRVKIDPLEQIDGLRVDVVPATEKSPNETLDGSDNSSHQIKVWIRKPLPSDPDAANEAIADLLQFKRQLFLRLDNWNSPGRRVQVWECDSKDVPTPLKAMLIQAGLFATFITLRVEVRR